jgi:hypothetical protein
MDNQLQCKDLRTRTKNSLGVVESKFKFNRTDDLPNLSLFVERRRFFVNPYTQKLSQATKTPRPPLVYLLLDEEPFQNHKGEFARL